VNAVVDVFDSSGNARGAADTMLADGCHPNEKGYEAIAKAFYAAINSQYTTAVTETITNPTDVDMPSAGNINELAAGTLYGTYYVEKSNGYQLELKNLPKTDILGERYVYYIREAGTHVLDGSSYKLSENAYKYIAGVQYEDNGMTAYADDSMAIRNTIVTTDLHLTKTWSDGNENHEADTVSIRIHRDTVADSADARKNPLTLTLSKEEITLIKDSPLSEKVKASVPVKANPNDQVTVALDASMQTITLTAGADAQVGTQTITFTSDDGQKATLTVHIIEKPPLTLTLNKYTVTGGVDTAPVVSSVLTREDNDVKEDATYTSSDDSVISITSDGVMTVNGPGTATITASYGGETAERDVTVTYSTDFTLPETLTITAGDTQSLGIDPYFGTFTYDAPADSGLSFADGSVTAGTETGTFTVTVTRSDGKTHDVTVVVAKGTKDGTLQLSNSPGQTATYSYDETAGIITITVPPNTNQNDSSHKFNEIATNADLKALIPTKYEIIPTNSFNGEVSIFGPGNGWEKRTNQNIEAGSAVTFDASGTESFEQRKNSGHQDVLGFVCTNSAGPYTLKIYVKSGESGGGGSGGDPTTYDSGTFEVGDAFSEQGGNYKYYPDPSKKVAAGSTVRVVISGAQQGSLIQVAINDANTMFADSSADANGQVTIDISVPSETTLEHIDIWNYKESDWNSNNLDKSTLTLVSYTITPPNSTNAANAPARTLLTRFKSSALRLSSAKALATQLKEEEAQETQSVPESGTAAAPVQRGNVLLGITPQENANFDANGYIDRTMDASEDWAIQLTELPVYYVKPDGSVGTYYYWAEELSGADGYKASYSFKDADDETNYSINAALSGDAQIDVRNTRNQVEETILPESGGIGIGICYRIGAFLLLLAAAGFAAARYRRWFYE